MKLFSVSTRVQNETAFTYWGAQPDPKNRWKLKTWTRPAGEHLDVQRTTTWPA